MRKYSIALAVSLLLILAAAALMPSPSSPEEGTTDLAHQSAEVPLRDVGAAAPSTLIFTGDIMLDRGVRRVIERRGADHLFTEAVDSLFRSAQVVVGNLECPATHIVAPQQKRFIFRAEPEWLDVLRKHGITHLNLANNHSVDQGRRGLNDTRRRITAAGMTPIGAGASVSEACRPVLLTASPRPVWLFASLQLALENFAYLEHAVSVAQQPIDSLLSQVHRWRLQHPHDVIIVSLHWGAEHQLEPTSSQRLEAHRLVDAGADALVCHHTHTLQTVEHYRGRTIFYSLGNFIFDQPKPLNSMAAVASLKVTPDSLFVSTLPVVIDHCVPHLQPLR